MSFASVHKHSCGVSGCISRLDDCNCSMQAGTWWCDLHESFRGSGAPDAVNHPRHYGGADNPYETIKVIRAWELGFTLGNTVKYISRAGRKGSGKMIEDLKKAAWYLAEEIAFLERGCK